MGQNISLTAGDGHSLGAYRANPPGSPKGAVVIIQEIFGVNGHVRNICDQYAAAGYVAIAPALFDRVEPGLDLGYGEEDFANGRETRGKLENDGIVADVQAAVDEAAKSGKVGVIGYCFGGAVAWMAATTCTGVACASCYYGGGIYATKDATAKCPVQFHFGDNDGGISLGNVHEIKEAQPDIPTYVYDDSGHGFCCDERDSFNPSACGRARERTLSQLAANVG